MMFDGAKLKVLVFSNSDDSSSIVERAFKSLGVQKVVRQSDGYEAFDAVIKEAPDIVVIDEPVPGLISVELIGKIRRDDRSPKQEAHIVLCTGVSSGGTSLTDAIDAGVSEYMAKPFAERFFCDKVVKLLTEQRPFIRAAGYVGPDRRWKKGGSSGGGDYKGPDRRRYS